MDGNYPEHRFNIIDGHVDFTIEVERFHARSGRCLHGLLRWRGGVQPQSGNRLASGQQIRFFLAGIREQDGPHRRSILPAVDQMKTRLKANPVPVVIPIGAEENFTGVVDLFKMKAIIWDEASQGT